MNITDKTMETLATYMNDEIREAMHGYPEYDTNEKFLSEYVKRDQEFVAVLKSEFREIYEAIV